MINPADARAFYFYTPQEVHTARYILKNQGRATNTNPNNRSANIYPPEFVTWANKVLTWYGRFCQLLRRYARALSSVQLAQIAIWQNLKNGLSLPRLLKMDSHEAQEHRTAPARWIKNPPRSHDERARHGDYITPHTEKRSHKTERRAQIARQTAALQMATI